jgi:hypothetical protein
MTPYNLLGYFSYHKGGAISSAWKSVNDGQTTLVHGDEGGARRNNLL